MPALDALEILKEGNKNFVSNNNPLGTIREYNNSRSCPANYCQHPFAVIVCCSDSRLPPEIIFDQALGDIFVVRTAGNILDSVGMGSVEYGIKYLNARLVVVLGHEECGAVRACVKEKQSSENINNIIQKIKPSLDLVKSEACPNSPDDIDTLCRKVEDANIRETVRLLRENPIVSKIFTEFNGLVIGAKYFLKSGEVVFESI